MYLKDLLLEIKHNGKQYLVFYSDIFFDIIHSMCSGNWLQDNDNSLLYDLQQNQNLVHQQHNLPWGDEPFVNHDFNVLGLINFKSDKE